MRHPEFGGGSVITVRLRLHKNLDDPYGAVAEVFLMSEYDDHISFEPSEDGTKGMLRGFTRNGHKVDIIAYARTR
jgi:hypothetical protein